MPNFADMKTSDRFQSWSRYWSSGSVESCLGSQTVHSNQLLQFWQQVFLTLTDGCRVLDVATGNGVLPHLAITLLKNSRRVDFEAIDIAKIAPDWVSHLGQPQHVHVHFHGETAAEKLPFPDASMELVISQFGLEYTDMSRTLPEIRRVLRENGAVALAVHDQDSLIVRQAKAELGELAWLADSGAFELAAIMCTYAAAAAAPEGAARLANDTDAIAARAKFNALLAELSDRKRNSGEVAALIHGCVESLLQAVALAHRDGDAATAHARVAWLSQLYTDMQFRHRELVEHALNAAGVQTLAKGLGMRHLQTSPLCDSSGNTLAWGIRGQS